MLQAIQPGFLGMMSPRRRGTVHAMSSSHPFSLRTANEKEVVMKLTILAISLVAAAALTALGQEGVVQDVKQGAKKAGQTIKDGVETAGKKTKEVAETVGEKTKETAKTVGRKTKETAQTVGQKTKETAKTVGQKTKDTAETVGEKTKDSGKTVHRKSKTMSEKANPETNGQQSTNPAPNTPSPNDR